MTCVFFLLNCKDWQEEYSVDIFVDYRGPSICGGGIGCRVWVKSVLESGKPAVVMLDDVKHATAVNKKTCRNNAQILFSLCVYSFRNYHIANVLYQEWFEELEGNVAFLDCDLLGTCASHLRLSLDHLQPRRSGL